MNIPSGIKTFSDQDLSGFCDRLGNKEPLIRKIIKRYGYPSIPVRAQGFEGLVRLILEQQVSLASALSVMEKLGQQVNRITPDNIIQLNESDFKTCGFSKQKIRYVKALAMAVHEGRLDIGSLPGQADHEIRRKLLAITGIGKWTCDCYLLIYLKRLDIFPIGDLALRKSLVENRLVPENTSKSVMEEFVLSFSPCRSILALILWHAYKAKRGITIGQAS